MSFVPQGHFYSPEPDLNEIRTREAKLWQVPTEIPGIDLNTQVQLKLFEEFKQFYKDLPFPEHKVPELRYYYCNGGYEFSDAICLYSVLRKLQPKRLIEVGSGFSSCVSLDTNERFLNNSCQMTFIEPYPDEFNRRTRPEDKQLLLQSKLQDVPLEFFKQLQENDILFIDSTHVSKIGSDVNYYMFEILPILNKGVWIHIHDIFYPFMYPKEWVYGERVWSEIYLLRAFLQCNSQFKIQFFNTYLEHFYEDLFKQHMPLCLKQIGGSIWIKKE